jgi:hypothetical protein
MDLNKILQTEKINDWKTSLIIPIVIKYGDAAANDIEAMEIVKEFYDFSARYISRNLITKVDYALNRFVVNASYNQTTKPNPWWAMRKILLNFIPVIEDNKVDFDFDAFAGIESMKPVQDGRFVISLDSKGRLIATEPFDGTVLAVDKTFSYLKNRIINGEDVQLRGSIKTITPRNGGRTFKVFIPLFN